jgi:enoyl-CoA hydratase/carnithine racemase
MPTVPEPQWKDLTLERRGDVFILTMRKAPENRINIAFAQEIISALRYIQRTLGPLSSGALITKGFDEKFWCTGLDLDEAERDPFANSDGFYPLLAAMMDFPYPTVALLTGHTFGGACPFALSHDYRVMNSKRGFLSMVRLLPISCPLHC